MKIKKSPTVRFFLSENQESRVSTLYTAADRNNTPFSRQNDVRAIAIKHGLVSVDRRLAWLRMGYVEELFVVNEPPALSSDACVLYDSMKTRCATTYHSNAFPAIQLMILFAVVVFVGWKRFERHK